MVELLNQPFNGQLGDRLIDLLETSSYQALNIIVAFAKNSGVLRIKDSLDAFRKRGGKVNAYVGVDLGGTSYEALVSLLQHTDSLSIVHFEEQQTFHPKIYQFIGDGEGLVVIGSHNLTAGGLWTNFESSVIIPVLGSSSKEAQVQAEVDEYIAKLASLGDSFMPIAAKEDLETLLENEYVFKEVAERVRRANAAKRRMGKSRLFGRGVKTKLPSVSDVPKELPKADTSSAQQESPVLPATEEDQTIWFETRAMTGGSRNILDLSKKSLIESGDPSGTAFELEDSRFMRGGVEFFGLNPEDTKEVKSVTINFEGVDYEDNTILFPAGDNANGTWRLQIKGRSSSNRKITDAFIGRDEGYYLQNKVVTFTKVHAGYYYMSVYPASELQSFKEASRIVARNGSTARAKLLGLL